MWLTRTHPLVAAGVALTLIAVTSSPALGAGTDKGLCRHTTDRVTIPANLAVDACFDGTRVHLKNRTEFVLAVRASGSAGDPRRINPDPPALASAVIAASAAVTVLPPGYGVSFAVGSGSAGITISADDTRGRQYVLARALVGFLPPGYAVYEGIASLVSDVDKAAVTARQCFDAGKDPFSKAGCGLRFGWDFAVALAAFALRFRVALAGPIAGAILNLIETAVWAFNAVSGAGEYIRAAKELSVAAQQPAPPTAAAPPPAPVPTTAAPTPAAPTGAAPPPAQAAVVHYDCANDNSDIGRYISPNRYWENDFVAQGTTITGGWVLIGAHENGADHRARVGIYTGSGRGGPLAEVVVAARGYDGEPFTVPPIRVSPGQRLWIAVTGIGDFTAYDNRSGCFIARVDGRR